MVGPSWPFPQPMVARPRRSRYCLTLAVVMKIVVPYTVRLEPVEEVLEPFSPQWVDVSGDVEAYYRLLRDTWAEGERFIVVEHDNVPTAEVLQELWDCPYAWCGSPYLVMGRIQAALGCTRFHEVLLKTVDDLWVQVPFTRAEYRAWPHLDVVMHMALVERGVGMHIHETVIDHLNPVAAEYPFTTPPAPGSDLLVPAPVLPVVNEPVDQGNLDRLIG